jgi:hypothetical protein
VGLVGLAAVSGASSLEARFRAANELARAGDYPKAIAGFGEVAAAGGESASLYWNWAQAAAARGATGEALWALLRAREIDPGDRAVGREIDRLREALNLDPAETAPEPLAAVGRAVRRFHLDLLAAGLLAGSLLFHLLARLAGGLLRATHRGRRPAWGPALRRGLPDRRAERTAAGGRGGAGARGGRQLAAGGGQRRRARLGPLGGRAAPRPRPGRRLRHPEPPPDSRWPAQPALQVHGCDGLAFSPASQ